MMLKYSSDPVHLLDLPSELLLEILCNLSYQHLLQCCLVCHILKATVDNYLGLQYKIELGVDGMVDGPPNSAGTAARLNVLLSRRKAWARLQWNQRIPVAIPGSCQAYELVAGVFAKSTPVGGATRGSRHFLARSLPSASDGPHDGMSIERLDTGFLSRDFAIDPTQDLIAFVEIVASANHSGRQICVHLCTISTNRTHSEASVPILHHFTPNQIPHAFIQIVDDIIGMFVSVLGHGPEIIIWNWKTGDSLVLRDKSDLPDATSDFSFLSSRSYMLTCKASMGSIEIYTFGLDGRPSAHIASLQLPQIDPDISIASLSTHTGPFHAHCPDGKLFTTSPDSRIHVISVEYTHQSHVLSYRPRYCLFVHNRTLLEYISSYVPPSGLMVLWVHWGPHNTRFLVHYIPFQWLRYVHGQRVICPPLHHESRHTMQILDFNVRPFLKSPSLIDAGIPEKSDNRLVTTYSRIAANIVFREDVMTGLPYRTLSRTDSVRYSGYMIDEERLVGLMSTAYSEGPMDEIHVFTF